MNEKVEIYKHIYKDSNMSVSSLKKLKEELKDKDLFKDYAKVLYSEARLIEGLQIDNPTEITNLICDIISK